jgi:hypothetical protein
MYEKDEKNLQPDQDLMLYCFSALPTILLTLPAFFHMFSLYDNNSLLYQKQIPLEASHCFLNQEIL